MLHKNSASFPVLTTERLILRQLELSDDEQVFALRSDSEINKYLGRKAAQSIEDARTFINRVNGNVANSEALYWAITFRNKTALVGTICLYGFSEDGSGCEVGYELLTNYQGQGIMHEALAKVIGYAFQTINVHHIDAVFHRDNVGSLKLLEKFEFRDSNLSNDSEPDLVTYRLINSDRTETPCAK